MRSTGKHRESCAFIARMRPWLIIGAAIAGAAIAGCTPKEGGGGGNGGAGGSAAGAGGRGGGGGATAGAGGSGAAGGGAPGTGGAASGGAGVAGGGSGAGAGGSAGASGGSGPGAGGGGGSGGRDAGAADTQMTAIPITGNGCAGGACLNPTCMAMGMPRPVEPFPEIGFEPRPSYIPNNVIVPTFDDVPDPMHLPSDGDKYTNFMAGEWTRQLVEFLDANNLHFDMFINTVNFCDLSKDPRCVDAVRAMVRTQNVANHTVHHMHMGGNTPPNPADLATSSCGGAAAMYRCEDEIVGVETLVNQVSNGGIPHLTRLRAPYGEPFNLGPGAEVVKPIVARHAVHIGWQIDSLDSLCDNCRYTGQKIADTVIQQIGTGPGKGQNWGIVLMHGTYPWSYEAAKILFDPKTGYLATHGFKLATVEDVICWKYGKHSWEIIAQKTGSARGPN
jgi:peptidoglycan/xylan/chitin deacetylase (PgdA/CDA1 family)